MRVISEHMLILGYGSIHLKALFAFLQTRNHVIACFLLRFSRNYILTFRRRNQMQRIRHREVQYRLLTFLKRRTSVAALFLSNISALYRICSLISKIKHVSYSLTALETLLLSFLRKSAKSKITNSSFTNIVPLRLWIIIHFSAKKCSFIAYKCTVEATINSIMVLDYLLVSAVF